VDGRTEKLLPGSVDVMHHGRQRERHGAVEGVLKQQLGTDDVASGDGVVQLQAERAADLLAQQPKLDDDVGRAEALLDDPAASVLLGGVQHSRVVERGARVDPARRSAAQQRDDRVEQRRHVLANRQLPAVVVERLARGRLEPALQDVRPARRQGLGHPTQVRSPRQDLHTIAEVHLLLIHPHERA